MDRQMELEHLAKAERHVAEGLEHIQRQCEVIAQLERGEGHEQAIERARTLLNTFLESQVLHEQHLADIRVELARSRD